MFKKSLICLVIFLAIITQAKAQVIWEDGYVILKSGDSLTGQIRYNSASGVCKKVTLKDKSGKKVAYKAVDCKCFGAGYLPPKRSILFPNGKCLFLSTVIDGELTLLSMGSAESDYDGYMLQKKSNRETAERIRRGNFKEVIMKYVSDDKEVVDNINKEVWKYSDLTTIITQYNLHKSEKK